MCAFAGGDGGNIADVVIIGAGVIGCSTAYHLTQMGITDVAVVEMNEIGSGSSSKSASMLTRQFHDELSIRMANYSYTRYLAFEEEMGVPTDFNPIGWLTLATAETADDLLENARLLQSLNVQTDIVTPDEIKRRYPEINTADVVLGIFGPEDGPFDPHMIMTGYVRRARERGVRVHEDVRATGIQTRGRQVQGVTTDHGVIATRCVVNAAGAWADQVGRWVGVEIPIINLARTIVVTAPFPAIPLTRPLIEDATAEWYVRPEGPGFLMGMGKEPAPHPDMPFDRAARDRIIDVALHRVPMLAEAPFLTGWTGVRPMTPDNHPIIGPVPRLEGLVLNCGWDGAGIINAPLAGQLVAEYISTGRTTTMELDPFRIERLL